MKIHVKNWLNEGFHIKYIVFLPYVSKFLAVHSACQAYVHHCIILRLLKAINIGTFYYLSSWHLSQTFKYTFLTLFVDAIYTFILRI